MDPIYILHPHLVTHTFEHLNIALVNDVIYTQNVELLNSNQLRI